jgi:hypothetical protein
VTGPPYLNRETRAKLKTLRRQPSLRSQLNQIRLWVRQGRTDAWIAHKIDVSIDELTRFKREHDLEADDTAPLRPADPLSVPAPDPSAEEPEEEEAEELEEPGEEDELEADRPPRARRPRRETEPRPRRPRREPEPRARRPRREEADEEAAAPAPSAEADGDRDGEPARRRRRGRRGGRRHRGRRSALEATFDHGEEGYGLWLDPAVVDNPVYSEHWAGHRAVTVTVEPDAITIRRAGAPAPPEPDEPEE